MIQLHNDRKVMSTTIVEGQTFPSLVAFKEALRIWAVERNFTPHILDSDSRRVRVGCRSSSDCPFRIRANFSEKRGNAKVTTCDDVHNCVSTAEHPVSQTCKRPETGKLKFLIEAVPKLIDVREKMTVLIIQEAIERKYGQKLPVRQAQRVKRALEGKPKSPCSECHQMTHSKRSCPRLHPRQGHPDAGEAYIEHDNHDTQVDITDNRINRIENQPCARCFQPGHTQDQCQSDTNPRIITNGITARHESNAAYLSTNREHAPIDPVFRLNMQPTRPTNTSQTIPMNEAIHPPHPENDQDPGLHQEHLMRDPQNSRVEAARLMQRAARLMQEAAKLNFEAARLTASLANS